jgi:hypothetical protein
MHTIDKTIRNKTVSISMEFLSVPTESKDNCLCIFTPDLLSLVSQIPYLIVSTKSEIVRMHSIQMHPVTSSLMLNVKVF